MNRLDDQLDRLFRAAAARTAPAFSTAPYGLDTRVLAAWRESGGAFVFWNPALLLRGLVLAGVIMVISFLPLWHGNTSFESEYLQLADSNLTASITP